ncbi:Dual specificity protein kinase shkE [Monoraphidium neglectum]|uniref:Dual specificity protein kinase shkE n=1 Tax=Monoraphidium neglectum TaxID=145388 RepID=A0A0D2MV50_9CHLO|nr:Dual specificity protein kinase shkE [Monoraphidium neglectum]KIZ04397.1 Dual specificity protein kinase shkE [Monoraphidium neglectum]|eukprot:XP_013903416.1 Dual specificity protein kinase shkE [Monoraphidium neglectum]
MAGGVSPFASAPPTDAGEPHQQEQGADAPAATAPDSAGGAAGGAQAPHATSAGWLKAREAVMDRVGLSQAFHTLRDRAADARIDPARLKPIKTLGEGAFAWVESSWYSPPGGGKPFKVAVKHLKPELYGDEIELELFETEVELMRKLQHRNIVGLVGAGGVAVGDEGGAFMVQEFMAGPTLKKLVTRQMMLNPQRVYSDAAAIDICLQIARGLQYLHSAKPMVIHRDLKLENVLLNSDKPHDGRWEAKIADFGLSRRVEAKNAELARRRSSLLSALSVASEAAGAKDGDGLERVWAARACKGQLARQASGKQARAGAAAFNLTGRTGSLMYMAPEVYLQQPYNEKADVFSFGVMMFELLQKYIMLSAISIKGTYEELEAYAARVAGGFRPPLHDRWPPEISSLIKDCWAQDPRKRPAMEEVVSRLEDIQGLDFLTQETWSDCACCVVS